MENIPNDLVYHGSGKKFDSELATPRRNIRGKKNENTGEHEVTFDQISFHATPYKWIALAYTYDPKVYELNGKKIHYNMGVSLYDNNKEVMIYGFESLEKSLEKLYGDGGYIYHFDKDKFYYTEGLGNLEVITNDPTKPDLIEKIDSPLEEMKKMGIKFEFTDLSLPENEKFRNYV